MSDQTPALNEFRRAYEADSNVWWRLDSGHHLNLFEAALEALDDARQAIEVVQQAHEKQLLRFAAKRAKDERKIARLKDALARVQALTFKSDDGSEYEHDHGIGDGHDQCPACWAEDIRKAAQA